ncbi:hypothetical protein [Deinococcus cavernae]|nr:hypothetical protein [Deinococcus cavernae]
MKAEIKRRGSRTVLRRRMAQIQTQVDVIAQRVAKEGERHAQRGAYLNVYSTVVGQGYLRTRHLFDQIYAVGHGAGGQISVTVGDYASYASEVEFGSGPFALNAAQMEGYLKALAPGKLLTFGRSGQKYLLPGPYIGPALHLVQYRTQWEIRDLMRRLWV